MHKPLRLGVIGLGAMGRQMLAAAAGHPDFTVARAFDTNPAAIEHVPDGVPFSADFSDVDALYIATPPAFHAEYAIPALKAGQAVFCEKPLAVSLEDGQRMVAAGGVGAVNFALSDRDAVLEVERSLRAGELGDVRGVSIRLAFPRWPRDFQAEAGWLARPEQGGFVREVLSHFVYLTDRLLGPLTAVEVGIDAEAGASEHAAHGFLRAGEVPVHVSAFSGAAGPELYEWTLWGTRRSYQLRQWGELLVSDGGEWQPVPFTGTRGSDASRLSLFAAAIRGEHSPHLADFAAGLRVQTAIEAFHRSSS